MRLSFVAADGTRTPTEGREGERLLDVAQRAGQPLEGTCNGFMACGTCHVLLAEPALATLPPASAEEEDMLDLLPHATRRSRLSCQVRLVATLDGMVVEVPAG
ncbi:2Fe-2S iron-sulfur cluster-binding protein [Sphingomonas bacterium]|uniref:2Fe-2S iron-sulfur cluster-binding protein n=1 Tax=Sphingomonas bacterium TaxID=1895847 RepID=UPI001575D855|nr:2Fe-2S iron-sulfur cluster-binding protein [Sphingomonas bacterium]